MPIIDNTPGIYRKPAAVVKAERDKRDRAELVNRIKSLRLPNGTLHKIVAATPIIATNAVAVMFQWRFAQSALGGNPVISALFSATLESIAVSIAYHAHLARLSNLRSGTLRLASVFVALGIAVLNASHEYNANLALAATAFGCSFISPFLWEMYSRQVSSVILVTTGHLDYAPIRLGIDRWLFHPVRAFQVKRDSSWTGERSIHRAIQQTDKRIADRIAAKAAAKAVANLDNELKDIR